MKNTTIMSENCGDDLIEEELSNDLASNKECPRAKHQVISDTADRLITECSTRQYVALDLSHQNLKEIPKKLLQLQGLQYLYLEGNGISYLPENFFDCLPNLQWLDLRNNELQTLPSAYIGRHQFLRNLLLEGNNLVTLPLELGFVSTLNGLSIHNNPLEFPPSDIIERGTQMVLTFLREVLKAKATGKMFTVPKVEDLKIEYDGSSSEEDDNHSNSRHNSPQHSRSSSKYSRRGSDLQELRRPSTDNSELGALVMHSSASLQQRTNYNELRQQQTDKLRKVGALGLVEKSELLKSSRNKKLTKLSQYPEPPSPELVQDTYIKEKRLAKLRHLKEKQEMVLQRRKDQDVLANWRDEGKLLQREKYREKIIKGGKLDYAEPATQAPFGVEKGHLKMQTNEERIANDIREKHEKMRRTVSPGAQQRMEEANALRDRELERKLKQHTHQMRERRSKPKGTPQEEMSAAEKELRIAEQMHRELEQRRKALEYRFTAFTGDSVL